MLLEPGGSGLTILPRGWGTSNQHLPLKGSAGSSLLTFPAGDASAPCSGPDVRCEEVFLFSFRLIKIACQAKIMLKLQKHIKLLNLSDSILFNLAYHNLFFLFLIAEQMLYYIDFVLGIKCFNKH